MLLIESTISRYIVKLSGSNQSKRTRKPLFPIDNFRQFVRSEMCGLFIWNYWNLSVNGITLTPDDQMCLQGKKLFKNYFALILVCRPPWDCFMLNNNLTWLPPWSCFNIKQKYLRCTTELYYISGDRALGCRVSPKTWRL